MATKRVNIDIVAKDKSQQALNKVRGNLDGVKKAVFNVRNALAGLGAGLVIRNLVNTGKEIEGLQVRLKFLFGSVEEGAKAFDKMAKFASKVPFSLQEIQAGSGNLAVVAKDADELAKLMEITGNVAAATGLDFRTTAEQIQRSFSAGIGAADLFRDRGVRAMLGFKAGATVSIEETQEAFENVFGNGGKFAGTTDALAQTLEGTLSMIGDKVFTFKKTLLDAGFFAQLKTEFGDLNKFLADNEKTLNELAITIGKGLANAVISLSESIKFVADNFQTLKAAVGGFIAFKLAHTFLKIASAARKFFLTLTGITALTGPRGLALVSVAIGTMTAAAMMLPDPLVAVREEFEKLTQPEIKNKIKNITEEIKKLEESNKKLEESMKDMVPEIDMPEIGSLDDEFNKFKDGIIEIPDLLDGATASMTSNSVEIAKLKAELEVLIQVYSSHNAVLDEENTLLTAHMRVRHNFNKSIEDTKDIIVEEIKTYDILQKAREKLAKNQVIFDSIKQRGMTEMELIEKRMKDELDLVKESHLQLQLIRDTAIANGQMSERMANSLYLEELKKLQEMELEIITQGKTARQELLNKEAQEKLDLMKRTFNEQLAILRSGKFQELDLEKLSTEQKKDLAKTAGRDLLEQLAQNNKKAFQVNKALNIAEAIMNTAKGVSKALGQGNFIMAALIGGLGAVQIAKIANTQYQGRAGGGSVNKDQAYMVGEKGPEMFVPSGSGKIVPNNQMGSGQPVNVNFNINTVDARGFNELLVNSRGVIINMINSAVNEKGRMAIV